MEVEMSVSAAAADAAPAPLTFKALGGDFGEIPIQTLSIDDYLERNKPPLKVAPREPQVTSSKKRVQTPVEGGTPTDGVEVSRSIATHHARDLHEYITKYYPKIGIPEFVFTEQKQSRFSVVLKFGCGLQDVEPPYVQQEDGDEALLPQLFPSKKAAKEAAAAQGLEFLRSLPEVTSAELGSPNNGGVGGDKENESYVALLHTFCSKNKIGDPVFTDFQSTKAPALFGCEVELTRWQNKVFGDRTPRYTGKRSARNDAAKAALEWLKSDISILQVEPGSPASAQAVRALIPGSVIEVDGKGKTYGSMINEILPKLGFKAVKFDLENEPQMDGMYNVYAMLVRPPELAFKIGPLKHQFGKKKAREEMSKYILRYLNTFTENHGMTLLVSNVDVDDIS